MTKRLKPDDRRAQIIAAALDEAEQVGYRCMLRKSIAKRAGCTEALVSHYFGTRKQLTRAVMRAAIAQGRSRIIMQGRLINDPQAMKAGSFVL